MESVEITKRYAKAFYDLVLSEGKKNKKVLLDQVLDELEKILSVIKKEKEIEEFLFSPIVKKTKKALFLKKIFDIVLKEQGSSILKTFLFFLNEKQRLNFLEPIAKAFRELKEKDSSFLYVHIHSARASEFSPDEEDRWKKVLFQKTKKSVKVLFQKEESLIAGAKIEMDGLIIEGSFSQDLKKMEDLLKKGSA